MLCTVTVGSGVAGVAACRQSTCAVPCGAPTVVGNVIGIATVWVRVLCPTSIETVRVWLEPLAADSVQVTWTCWPAAVLDGLIVA